MRRGFQPTPSKLKHMLSVSALKFWFFLLKKKIKPYNLCGINNFTPLVCGERTGARTKNHVQAWPWMDGFSFIWALLFQIWHNWFFFLFKMSSLLHHLLENIKMWQEVAVGGSLTCWGISDIKIGNSRGFRFTRQSSVDEAGNFLWGRFEISLNIHFVLNVYLPENHNFT